MNGRWTSVDGYQRTRGALRFLASCLHALKVKGGARALLGPGDIHLSDADVNRAMFKDLDPTQQYAPVITHDLVGPNARARRVDDRLAKETPALANVRPATRLATAILAYSFGGLKREDGEETIPPGVTETELLAACVAPDLDSFTASAVLGELRNSCLYLHYDGVRYCFKKDPNVTKLVEDAEQEVGRDPEAVRERIKEMLEGRLAGKQGVIVWPPTNQDLPDKEPVFQVAYMPLEFAGRGPGQQEDAAKQMLWKYGDGPRQFRNGVALAIPDKKQVESLRRAVRYLMAVERVEGRKAQHRLTKDQLEQLRERRKTEEGAVESAFRNLYTAVWLPRLGPGAVQDVEKVEVGGRPLQAAGVHERVMELLTGTTPKVHGSVTPRKAADRVKLSETAAAGEAPRLGIAVADIVEAFFAYMEPPRVLSADVVRRAVAKGVADGVWAYTTGRPMLGPDGKYQVSLAKVVARRPVTDDEIDLDDGFVMLPAAVPAAEPAGTPVTAAPVMTPGAGTSPGNAAMAPAPVSPQPAARARTSIRISFPASRDDVFKSFQAIANLADKSDGQKITIVVEGQCAGGFDKSWLRNAVQEPLDEANIPGLKVE